MRHVVAYKSSRALMRGGRLREVLIIGALTKKMLVFCIGGRWWEAVTYESWSDIEVWLYQSSLLAPRLRCIKQKGIAKINKMAASKLK